MRVPLNKEKALQSLVKRLKENGNNKKYDCVIGVSGGVDSTYLAYIIKNLGLRPLAVHLDNGWDAELAVSNIQKVLNKLNIELYTHVLDWEEFKALQVAFLKASTPDSEIPTDHAIFAVLREMAAKEGVPIIAGTNHSSESILPRAWSQGYSDWAYIKQVYKSYGKGRIKTFPHTSLIKKFYYDRIIRQKTYSVLDFIDYDKEKAKLFLINELGYGITGVSTIESIYTRFFQSYILPTKFGFDKRRAHLSSLIIAKQITEARL
ncbi:MAG: N-acetyl sugar amidotransferase [Ignavibacteriales bacterium]|nr:N-acetyl sugar amidotransferase [Ignavibacteriales bacterium]